MSTYTVAMRPFPPYKFLILQPSTTRRPHWHCRLFRLPLCAADKRGRLAQSQLPLGRDFQGNRLHDQGWRTEPGKEPGNSKKRKTWREVPRPYVQIVPRMTDGPNDSWKEMPRCQALTASGR